MISEGIVVEINKSYAVVNVKRQSACGENCASCGGCEKNSVSVNAVNSVNADKGDKVLVESKTSAVLCSAFVIYIIPLFVFLSVYCFLAKLGEGIAAGISALLFVTSFWVIKHLYKKIPEVRIIRILKTEKEND